MKGLLALVAMLAFTAWALVAPWPILAGLTLGALALLRSGRGMLALFLAFALTMNVALAWFVLGRTPEAMLVGMLAALRLAATMGMNLAILSWVPPARLLDDVPMPARLRALLAAVLIAAHDVARDFERLRMARRLRGDWPGSRLARARESARLLPPLILAAHERASTRRDALRVAGHAVGAHFVAVVAIAALAAAGRLAFLPLPNVALTYVVVFLGGLLFGPLAAMLGGALGMLLTDFMLTGFYPPGLVNVPAMALLGLCGGLLGRFDWLGTTRVERQAGLVFAACAGIACTFLFSVASDSMTWLFVYAGEPRMWVALVAMGLAFNVVPAFVNGALFAASVTPTLRAFRAREQGARARTQPRGPETAPFEAPLPP